MFKELARVVAVTTLLFATTVIADDDDRGDSRETESARCYPVDSPVISSAGVKSISRCFHGSLPIVVSGRSNPWDQSLNPTKVYSASGDAFAPGMVVLASYRIRSGDYISLACTGGTTNAGGLPQTGCEGLKGFGFPPTDDVFQPACGTYYPSAFMDASNYPTWVFQVVGVFTKSNGVIVGKPFPVTSATQFVAVPKHAAVLQLGMNDCLNSDNSADPLTVKLAF